MRFRKTMSARHCYSAADGWRKKYVCKVQMRVWLFWVDVKTLTDDDEEYFERCAEEVIGYLKD